MATANFKLQNISCSSCIMHLEAMEDDLIGVKKVDTNFKQQTMKIDYDDKLQSPEGIAAAVSGMGYLAIPLSEADNIQKGESGWKKLFR